MRSPRRSKLRHHALSAALLSVLAVPAVSAQAPATDSATELDRVTVTGQIAYRDRSEATAPTLSYGLDYFQRFEPLTVGDMLKRVPSVGFVSDVLEYDGARLRGLDPGYTQILINGRKVPGAGGDRSFYVDRIPAELVERIEIIRSPSANRSGDAVAGALNIVLRDAYEFDGGYLRAGALHFDDGKIKPVFGAVGSGEVAGGRLLGGVNVQGRHNPKRKRSDRFDAPDGDFVDREDQSDVRDGTDYSGNLSYTRDIGTGRLSLDGFYVHTDRTETENSREYNDPVSRERARLLSLNDQNVDIKQDNASLNARYVFDMAGGRSEIDLGYARFEDRRHDTEQEVGYDDEDSPPSFDGFEGTRILGDTRDSEFSLKLAHSRALGAAKMEFGIDGLDKRRTSALRTSDVEAEDEGEPLPAYADFARQASRIEERRLDPYLMFSGKRGRVDWETGLRYETTRAKIRSVAGEGEDAVRNDKDYGLLLPSAHLRFNLTGHDRLSASIARTVRRPDFNQLLPMTLEEEYGDNDFLGNPQLRPETAWGLDLGYEHRLGQRGVVGLNLFYRKVRDLIEIVGTGRPSATALDDHEDAIEDFLDDHPGAGPGTPGYPLLDPDSFVFTAANVDDGRVYGAEFDLSTPLTALGLADTGVFLNYSWLDSEVDDDFGRRRFNNQPRSVLNVGFIQDLPTLGMSFGASYRRQGDAYSRVLGEEVSTHYGADLEAFVEKRFGSRVAVRLTGSNLLNASKDENFNKFNTLGEQMDREFDEYEREREKAGPVYQLVVRYAF
ncbi:MULTISPECIES: TonB-dependent receptor [unclassified Lysobacter]|uniref:TonB-dependent receptor plug domain-containing protein n=1 Tax=unclassified Lysobacter TaxID=2635362 RepID=UPI001BEA28D1|nr:MULTISPECIES: TonB-dependent receptor [unclassified Lysobacter]MBT2747757.1 TonB-dependent receptor [Lysobacter sp. ISL-42]MBT2753847.1 TonB-dependent receptor [Lysobacter sp. ISL-50]MBT2779307.1 TonB-dependent receptor [Lysobacter sp. ISL-54]MBT2782855.1 TonB-dependent receptor [Lysobacter sp. ISL-52]